MRYEGKARIYQNSGNGNWNLQMEVDSYNLDPMNVQYFCNYGIALSSQYAMLYGRSDMDQNRKIYIFESIAGTWSSTVAAELSGASLGINFNCDVYSGKMAVTDTYAAFITCSDLHILENQAGNWVLMTAIHYNKLRTKISNKKYAKLVKTVEAGYKNGTIESVWKSFKEHKQHMNKREYKQLKKDVKDFVYPECTICCDKNCMENHCTTCKGRDKMVCRGHGNTIKNIKMMQFKYMN